MAGFPTLRRSAEAARRFVREGAAAVEVGIPFSDPLADGPVIQHAGQVALQNGVTTAMAIEMAGELAGEGAPVVVMTYVNPILTYGVERFASAVDSAGVSGVIVPDLPPDESETVTAPLRERGLATVFMVAPTSTPERVRAAARASSGFVYCVSVTGITGARSALPESLPSLVSRVKLQTPLPVAVGFGISSPEHVTALQGVADAAVVGSALVKALAEGDAAERLFSTLCAASGVSA